MTIPLTLLCNNYVFQNKFIRTKFCYSSMNVTLWNSTEEAITYICMGGISIFLHAYGIFLCYAIFDYQMEKPKDEKSPFDVLLKHLMNSQFCVLYYMCLIQFISLFSPPAVVAYNCFYYVSHIGVFLLNFHTASVFVTFYIRYVFVFQSDDVIGISVSVLAWKSLVWKIMLTFIAIFLDIFFPLKVVPLPFRMLTKQKEYDR